MTKTFRNPFLNLKGNYKYTLTETSILSDFIQIRVLIQSLGAGNDQDFPSGGFAAYERRDTCRTKHTETSTSDSVKIHTVYLALIPSASPQQQVGVEQMASLSCRPITITIDPNRNPFTARTQSIQQAAFQTPPQVSLLSPSPPLHKKSNNSRLQGGCPSL